MTDPATAVPGRILLATDLSARSDRALERALRLARQWGAKVIAVHAVFPEPIIPTDAGDLSWRRDRDAVEQARWRLKRDIGDAVDGLRVIEASGNPADEIAAVAEEEGCGLIVTGIAHEDTLGRMILGSTVERLVRMSPVPVLMVKQRAARDYGDIVVAVDFSPASTNAVRRTSELFPAANFTLLHAYDAPFVVEGDQTVLHEYMRRMEQEEAVPFLDRCGLDEETRAKARIVIEHGDPPRVAELFVADTAPDLTVVASHGRGALYDLAIGSNAGKLIQMVDSDVLLVRAAPGEG